MKKTYIFFTIVLTLFVFGISGSFLYSVKLLSFPQNDMTRLVFKSEDGRTDELDYRRFPSMQEGVHWFESSIESVDLKALNGKPYAVIVNRITSDWLKVYFNGVTIGRSGSREEDRSNHWNKLSVFPIPPEIVKDTNTVELEIHATYSMGGGKNPVFISTLEKAGKLKTWFDFILNYIILVAQGILVFSFLIYILGNIVSPVGTTKEYLLIAVALLFMAVYLVEYVSFNTFILPLYTTWKITEISLFSSTALINLSLFIHFKHRILLFFTIIIALCTVSLLLLFSGNILIFLNACDVMYWGIIAGFFGWLWVSIVHFKQSDFAKTLMFSTIILLVCTTTDLYHVYTSSKAVIPLTVFGVLTLAVMLIFLVASMYLKTLETLTRATVSAKTYYKKSVRDGMTGLYNHEYVIGHIKKQETPFSFILIDIDNFKEINDRYGHPAGDDIIIHVAESIKQSVRKHDVAGRYGGDEFTIVLSECSIEKALDIADSVKEHAGSFENPLFDDGFKITLSIGVSEKTDSDTNYRDVITKADTALYRVKKQGKNGILKYSENLQKTPALINATSAEPKTPA